MCCGFPLEHPYLSMPKVLPPETRSSFHLYLDQYNGGRFVSQSTAACETITMETTALQVNFTGGVRICPASAAFTTLYKKNNTHKCFIKDIYILLLAVGQWLEYKDSPLYTILLAVNILKVEKLLTSMSIIYNDWYTVYSQKKEIVCIWSHNYHCPSLHFKRSLRSSLKNENN